MKEFSGSRLASDRGLMHPSQARTHEGEYLESKKRLCATGRSASFGTSTRTHARGVLFRVHKKAAPGTISTPAAGHLGAVRVRV